MTVDEAMQTHDENHKQQNKTLVKTNCSASKNTINTVKRQLMEWEEVCANHVSNKGLASKNKQTKKRTLTTQHQKDK